MFLYVVRRQHVYSSSSKELNFTSDTILKTTETVWGVNKATEKYKIRIIKR